MPLLLARSMERTAVLLPLCAASVLSLDANEGNVMESTSRKHQTVFVVPLLALFACVDAGPPSDPGAAACGEVSACGGDPTGSWTVDGLCVDMSRFSPNSESCAIAVSFDDVEYTGHAEFNADHTYVMTYTPSGPMKIVLRMPCIDADGVQKTCTDFDEDMRGVWPAEESPFQSGRCAMTGGDCVCDLFFREEPRTETGLWDVWGTTLTTKEDGEEWGFKDRPICVEGSSLTLGTEKLTEENEGKPMKGYMRLTKR